MLCVNLTGIQQLIDNFALKTLRHSWLLRLQKPFFWGKFQGKALSCTISRGCNLHSVYLKRLGYGISAGHLSVFVSRWPAPEVKPPHELRVKIIGTPSPRGPPDQDQTEVSVSAVECLHTSHGNRSFHPRQDGSLACYNEPGGASIYRI